MIEETIRKYLAGELEEPVYLEKPVDPPKKFVTVEKTGSSRNNLINSATLAVQSWADTMYGAAELNERVKSAMDAAASLPEVAGSRLNSDYNFTDTTTKKYRYQAVYDLTHY